MKKVTITLEFEGADAEYIDDKSGGVDVSVLLRDALADFRARRMTPTVEAYVASRYADADDRFRRLKTGDVAKRIDFSEVLGKARITVNVESSLRCDSVWIPGVLRPPNSALSTPTQKTRCALAAGHTGPHSSKHGRWGTVPEVLPETLDDGEND